MHKRRPLLIWWLDISKQGIGAFIAHTSNITLSEFFLGDPCTWYVANVLLDTSIGLLIIYLGIRTCHYVFKRKGYAVLRMGDYGTPPSFSVWAVQCAVYAFIVFVQKAFVVFVMDVFWDRIKDVVYPVVNEKVQKTLVLLVIPLILNIVMFWITDDILIIPKDPEIVEYIGLDQVEADADCVCRDN
ncbi:store-operated calcium entry regulator STIMATE-like [Cimex lectularius]|uniref:Uncharacterized protein n=1 Tax=Cimex lectularius TaxID=79782 RepID=A0A8I6RDB4_CIMLE|nr:store-operated calcium entry regulator STIMATE-like [Cimex lectularius]